MRSILKRIMRRHSTAVAYVALFAVLGGSAYAAVTVTGKDIKDGTITGRDVKNRSLNTSELSPKAVSSLTGQAGPQGPAGPPGPSGISGWEYQVSPGLAIAGNSGGSTQVDCPAGKKALGGGASTTTFYMKLVNSAPTDPGTGWVVSYQNEAASERVGYAWVICAHVTS